MNQDETVKRASELVDSKTGYIGGGMEGYAVLALIDESGCPTASTLTIAKAHGIKWLTFTTSPDSNKAQRITKDSRASVCLASSEYNITLVGKIEIIDDIEAKKDNWMPLMENGAHWTSPEDPNFCLLRFTTERYNIFFADPYAETRGML
ncbi:pyridoxamine 5'-phosphate oxidase family protein [Candidatus Saccharibacteria bacterium]|nr:pyridoxamine 5'-phosphate oxidase family protein [Candidatus Saccharibacteria bacterium]